MSKEMMGIDPEIKNKINKEGWEGNAAVIIGKEGEEIKGLEYNLENEGMCEDVATFVKMNKKIVVPAEEIPDNQKQHPGKGWIGSTRFVFIDKIGNICQIDFDFSKISSIGQSNDYRKQVEKVVTELGKYGFDIETGGNNGGFSADSYRDIHREIEKHRVTVQEQMRDKTKKEFDF